MAKIAVMVGSVYGAAQYVAEEATSLLGAMGHEPRLFAEPKLDDVLSFNADIWLVISSTTGQGDIPDNLLPFFLDVQSRFPLLTGKHFAVIALGDSSYDTFCGGGELMRELFAELGMREALPMLRLDASESVTPETDAEPWLGELIAALRA